MRDGQEIGEVSDKVFDQVWDEGGTKTAAFTRRHVWDFNALVTREIAAPETGAVRKTLLEFLRVYSPVIRGLRRFSGKAAGDCRSPRRFASDQVRRPLNLDDRLSGRMFDPLIERRQLCTMPGCQISQVLISHFVRDFRIGTQRIEIVGDSCGVPFFGEFAEQFPSFLHRNID
jgi:hypothetical protein